MRPKRKGLTFNDRTLVLFGYHEGFTSRLRRLDLRIFQDGTVEFQVFEFGNSNHFGFSMVDETLRKCLDVLLRRPSSDFPRMDFRSEWEDVGFASLECRMADDVSLVSRIDEPFPETDLSASETELINLTRTLKDFGFSLMESRS